jgi:predicted TIM-barrel fold metal-dependent hydrolase
MPHIDTHSHLSPPSLLSAIRQVHGQSSEFDAAWAMYLDMPEDSPVRRVDLRIEEMDGCGLGVSVLSIPPPGPTFGDQSIRNAVARNTNDELLATADDHPGRLAVLVMLPLPDVEASLAELERVAGHPHARGVGLFTVATDWTLDDPRLEPVYRRIAELGLPVQTHPAIEPQPAPFRDFALAATLAPIYSSSLGVARLVLSGMLDRVPDLELIVPHLGGILPYAAQRLIDFGNGDAEHDLAHYLRTRMYVDTCSFHPPAFQCAADTVGLERMVMGSDYPNRGPLARMVQDVKDNVSDETMQARVLGGTAGRWFAP